MNGVMLTWLLEHLHRHWNLQNEDISARVNPGPEDYSPPGVKFLLYGFAVFP